MALMKLQYDHCEFRCPNQRFGCTFIYSGGDKSMSMVHLSECNCHLEEISSEDYDGSASVSASNQYSSDIKDDFNFFAKTGKSDRTGDEKIINGKVLCRHEAKSPPLSNEQKSNVDQLSDKNKDTRFPSCVNSSKNLSPETTGRKESVVLSQSNRNNSISEIKPYNYDYPTNGKYSEILPDEMPILATEQVLHNENSHTDLYSRVELETKSPCGSCLDKQSPSCSSSLWTKTQTDTGLTSNDLLDSATSEREESVTSQKSINTNTTKVVPCYDEEYVDNRKYSENRPDEKPRLTTEQILSRASTHESGVSCYSGRGSSTLNQVIRGKISPSTRELFRF